MPSVSGVTLVSNKFANMKDLFVLPAVLDHAANCSSCETVVFKALSHTYIDETAGKTRPMLMQSSHCSMLVASLLLAQTHPNSVHQVRWATQLLLSCPVWCIGSKTIDQAILNACFTMLDPR